MQTVYELYGDSIRTLVLNDSDLLTYTQCNTVTMQISVNKAH